ncbi:serine/threonine-protein kinase [Noviherbaspirillum pedocola]|uniref:Serine/threonine protein kinase n=1 Tax=Noviherbaspirillum pedocola TaxID=2801341 RepID=A0A934T0W1_9BURK|nr:serine/threonine-protein kinase [Noviherbaspirillum pedocola]MBK4736787.1 serine/threonine protein kinase [Noviherbaspirillum pedocola]
MLRPIERAHLSFEFVRNIGQEGKNSEVYLARDHQLNADLVIKKISKGSFADPAAYFVEASILYQSEHANVVPVHYACQDEGFIYIAMPFFPNGSLKSLMDSRFLTVREIVRFAIQFLSGLHNIHTKGLIHFDIKPDNILLSKRKEALVSDFGLAKQMDSEGFAEQPISYTKISPPERVEGEGEFSILHDIYQTGVTLYRMCIGDKEFYLQWNSFFENGVFRRDLFMRAVKQGHFPDRTKFPEQIPQRLRAIVRKCMAPEEGNRYQSVLQITNALAEIDGPELDWRYEVAADGTRRWSCVSDGKECFLVVDPQGRSTAKKQNRTNAYTNINAFCKDAITPDDVRTFIETM